MQGRPPDRREWNQDGRGSRSTDPQWPGPLFGTHSGTLTAGRDVLVRAVFSIGVGSGDG